MKTAVRPDHRGCWRTPYVLWLSLAKIVREARDLRPGSVWLDFATTPLLPGSIGQLVCARVFALVLRVKCGNRCSATACSRLTLGRLNTKRLLLVLGLAALLAGCSTDHSSINGNWTAALTDSNGAQAFNFTTALTATLVRSWGFLLSKICLGKVFPPFRMHTMWRPAGCLPNSMFLAVRCGFMNFDSLPAGFLKSGVVAVKKIV